MEWRLHTYQLPDLYSYYGIIKVITLRRLWWTECGKWKQKYY